ncbi:hypothetical protein Tco_0573623 [Tanacetum coccineum]
MDEEWDPQKAHEQGTSNEEEELGSENESEEDSDWEEGDGYEDEQWEDSDDWVDEDVFYTQGSHNGPMDGGVPKVMGDGEGGAEYREESREDATVVGFIEGRTSNMEKNSNEEEGGPTKDTINSPIGLKGVNGPEQSGCDSRSSKQRDENGPAHKNVVNEPIVNNTSNCVSEKNNNTINCEYVAAEAKENSDNQNERSRSNNRNKDAIKSHTRSKERSSDCGNKLKGKLNLVRRQEVRKQSQSHLVVKFRAEGSLPDSGVWGNMLLLSGDGKWVRVEKMLKDVEMIDVVKEAWGAPVSTITPDYVFRDKLKNVKHALKKWSKKYSGLEQEFDSSRKEADGLKAKTLRQKARVRWYEKGDENSKFFHSTVRKRYQKNGFTGLMIDGRWNENPKDIKQTVFNYYQGVFKETNSNRPSFASGRFRRLSQGDASLLEAPFEDEEIWSAVKACGSSKAPGPDSFNFIFFKHCWEIIKEELLTALKWFWEEGKISRGCNTSFIALIPKVVDPICLAESLNVAMQEVVQGGLFNGVKVGSDGIEVSHLQYAADTIFVGDWNRRNIISLMKLLKCFQMASGLKVNLNKSTLFGIGVEMEEVEGWATSLRCRPGALPFYYLGLPVGHNMGRIENWNILVRKFKNKLAI